MEHFASVPKPVGDDTPSMDLPAFIQHVNSNGVTVVETHGGPGNVMLEYFVNMVDAQAAMEMYEEPGGYSGYHYYESELTVSAGEWHLIPNTDLPRDYIYGIALTSAGIQAKCHGNNDPGGLVALVACDALGTASSWNASAVIGYSSEVRAAYACDDMLVIFRRLGCYYGPGSANTLATAIADVPARPPGVSYVPLPEIVGDDEWTFRCGGCQNTDAIFTRVGAFEDVAWAVVDQYRSGGIDLYGYSNIQDYPGGGTPLRSITMRGDGRHLYVEAGVAAGYLWMGFVETNARGQKTWSEPFTITEQPSDWVGLVEHDGVEVPSTRGSPGPMSSTEVWFQNGEAHFGRASSKAGASALMSNPYQGVDVVIYSPRLDFLNEEWSTLDALGYSRKRAVWGTGTVPDQQAWAESITGENQAAQTWCEEHPLECAGPAFPDHPIFGIVGRRGSVASCWTEYLTYTDSTADCGLYPDYPCIDPNAGANFEGDAIEDLPVYNANTESTVELVNLRRTALRYERNDNPHGAAVFIVGDWSSTSGKNSQAEDALANLAEYSTSSGLPVFTLRSSYFAETGQLENRVQAFVNRVNAGASLIVGTGGTTTQNLWPGGFTPLGGEDTWPWASHFSTPQSVVTLLSGCSLARVNAYGFRLQHACVADTTGTTVAFGVGSVEGGNDLHHYLWAEVLGLAVRDAAVGTPWPRIIWDAKYRAVVQYPFLREYVRHVASLGTMVRKQVPGPTTGVGIARTVSDPGLLALHTFGSGGPRVTFVVTMPSRDEMCLVVFDVRGRKVATLLEQRKDAGRHQITWNGRDREGVAVHSGVYFAKVFTKHNGVATSKVVLVR